MAVNEVNNNPGLNNELDTLKQIETERAERQTQEAEQEQQRVENEALEQQRIDSERTEETRNDSLTPREIDESRGPQLPDDDRSREVTHFAGDSMRISPEGDEMAENVSANNPISLRE